MPQPVSLPLKSKHHSGGSRARMSRVRVRHRSVIGLQRKRSGQGNAQSLA